MIIVYQMDCRVPNLMQMMPLTGRDLGIGIVAFSPLGMGFFAGKTYHAESSANSVLG